jgi:hypothetical protein
MIVGVVVVLWRYHTDIEVGWLNIVITVVFVAGVGCYLSSKSILCVG